MSGLFIRKNLASTFFVSALLAALSICGAATAPAVLAQTRDWEPEIRKFEESDRVNPPKPGSIVFAGSSSLRLWSTLIEDMKPLDAVNRGFGGSQFTDLNQFARRIVIAYQPSAVVVYEGDNDLAAGSPKTPESVAGDFREFVRIVRAELPQTWIYVLSIKPSKLRWNEWPKARAANQMIQQFAKTQQRVEYIDVATPMFDARGELADDLFMPDRLHPTPQCYAIWTSVIKSALLERFSPGKTSQTSRTAPVLKLKFETRPAPAQ